VEKENFILDMDAYMEEAAAAAATAAPEVVVVVGLFPSLVVVSGSSLALVASSAGIIGVRVSEAVLVVVVVGLEEEEEEEENNNFSKEDMLKAEDLGCVDAGGGSWVACCIMSNASVAIFDASEDLTSLSPSSLSPLLWSSSAGD
jgi:hypothetical protein